MSKVQFHLELWDEGKKLNVTEGFQSEGKKCHLFCYQVLLHKAIKCYFSAIKSFIEHTHWLFLGETTAKHLITKKLYNICTLKWQEMPALVLISAKAQLYIPREKIMNIYVSCEWKTVFFPLSALFYCTHFFQGDLWNVFHHFTVHTTTHIRHFDKKSPTMTPTTGRWRVRFLQE